MNTNISKPHNTLKRKLKTNSVRIPKVLRIDSSESGSESTNSTDFINDLSLVSESEETKSTNRKFLEDQANHLVSMIKDTLENKIKN